MALIEGGNVGKPEALLLSGLYKPRYLLRASLHGCRYKLYIIGETTVAVNHCLLALPGVNKQDLKRVISHYQALAQVDGYTRNMGVIREAVDDTAGAAQMVAENGWRYSFPHNCRQRNHVKPKPAYTPAAELLGSACFITSSHL